MGRAPVETMKAAAARHLLHHLVLELAELRDVHPRRVHEDAALRRALHLLDEVRGRDERLRGDAPPVQAHAAEGALVHEGGLLAQLREPDGGDVAAGPRSDHDGVEGLGGHGVSGVPGGPGYNARGPGVTGPI
jgi:hypothetical protein